MIACPGPAEGPCIGPAARTYTANNVNEFSKEYDAIQNEIGYRLVPGPRSAALRILWNWRIASLSRSAGADMKLSQVTMGHASIMVTAHTYADLYDSDLDRVANALDRLGD